MRDRHLKFHEDRDNLGANADQFAQALAAGRVSQDIPVNHAPNFAPIMQPTLDTGTQALVVAALAWL